jgi:chemotaxis protein CheX
MPVPALLVTTLIRATEEVFQKMVFRRLVASAPIEDADRRLGAHVVGTVAFAGYRCGLVSLHSSTQAAREIAAGMLGLSAAAVNGEMPDAIGEITNIIAGTLRTRMSAFEPTWGIAVPTVTVGSDFSMRYGSNVARVLCPFRMGEEDLFIELILTQT